MNKGSFASTWPVLAKLLALLCCLLALGAALRMDIRLFPDRVLPEYTIRLQAPGLSADRIDERVTRPVEEAIRASGLALKISTLSQNQTASLTVKTKVRLFGSDREKLEQIMREVSGTLPLDSWELSSSNLADDRVGTYMVYGSDIQTIADAANRDLSEKLSAIPGVARVEVDDASLRQEVELVFHPTMLRAHGLTPGDVLGQLQAKGAAEQVGTIGKGADRTNFRWGREWTSPQELASELISTGKGYVPLKTLADIRDLRGSRGETVHVYKGSPAVAVTVYAAGGSQLPQLRAEVINAVDEVKQAADGRYQIDLIHDVAGILSAALRDGSILVILLASLTAIAVGLRLRSVSAGTLSFLFLLLSTGALLGGMWLVGMPLTLVSLGPVLLFALLYAGAGVWLFLRLAEERDLSAQGCVRSVWALMRPILLGIVIVAAVFTGLLTTDFIKASDAALLTDALPIIPLGTAVMTLVYGWIVPVLAAAWIPEGFPAVVREKTRRGWAVRLAARWERSVGLGFVPYGVTLAASLFAIVFFHPFVLVDPYGKTDGQQKTLSLSMIQGSSIDQSMQAAQVAEERLRKLEEVRDLYTAASRESLTFYLHLEEKDNWTRSRMDLEKELDKALREVPHTDPFAMIVSEDQKTRLELTIKGPSLHTSKEIADQLVTLMKGLQWTDEDGREIITDERIGAGTTGTYIEMTPKPEMLAHYQVTEAEIRRQLASYLGRQAAGSLAWNERAIPVTARFPDNWMEHPDQVKNILVRTPGGAVHLQDLAEWRLADEPPVFQREDGQYVIKVSSAVSQPDWIDGLAFSIPLQMEQKMPIPEGYRILTANELKKEQEQETKNTDKTGRFLAVSGAVLIVLAAALALQRRLRDSIIALAFVPVLAGGVMFGLLLLDRPLNVMGFYGMAATAALLVQQTLLFLDRLHLSAKAAETIMDGVKAASSRAVPALLIVLSSVILASLPFGLGWGSGDDVHGSFSATLLLGTILAGYAAIVLVPGVHTAAENRRLYSQPWTIPLIRKRLRNWWENEKVRRQDRRELKRSRFSRQTGDDSGERVHESASGRPGELSDEDFLPLPREVRDANL